MIEQIFLIGYRATGKTTIGTQLASKLRYTFTDTDHLICRKKNATIENIVKAEGWDGFRRYEANALEEARLLDKRVIATGGGAVLHSLQWEKICKTSFVVWLSADINTLTARLKNVAENDTSRPSLTGAAIHEEIARVLSERIELYRKYSDLEVDTAAMNIVEAVDFIIDAYRSRCGWSLK